MPKAADAENMTEFAMASAIEAFGRLFERIANSDMTFDSKAHRNAL